MRLAGLSALPAHSAKFSAGSSSPAQPVSTLPTLKAGRENPHVVRAVLVDLPLIEQARIDRWPLNRKEYKLLVPMVDVSIDPHHAQHYGLAERQALTVPFNDYVRLKRTFRPGHSIQLDVFRASPKSMFGLFAAPAHNVVAIPPEYTEERPDDKCLIMAARAAFKGKVLFDLAERTWDAPSKSEVKAERRLELRI